MRKLVCQTLLTIVTGYEKSIKMLMNVNGFLEKLMSLAEEDSEEVNRIFLRSFIWIDCRVGCKDHFSVHPLVWTQKNIFFL